MSEDPLPWLNIKTKYECVMHGRVDCEVCREAQKNFSTETGHYCVREVEDTNE